MKETAGNTNSPLITAWQNSLLPIGRQECSQLTVVQHTSTLGPLG